MLQQPTAISKLEHYILVATPSLADSSYMYMYVYIHLSFAWTACYFKTELQLNSCELRRVDSFSQKV